MVYRLFPDCGSRCKHTLCQLIPAAGNTGANLRDPPSQRRCKTEICTQRLRSENPTGDGQRARWGSGGEGREGWGRPRWAFYTAGEVVFFLRRAAAFTPKQREAQVHKHTPEEAFSEELGECGGTRWVGGGGWGGSGGWSATHPDHGG